MELIIYDKHFDDLKIDDIVKISIFYKNGFRVSIQEYIENITEHIWCKITDFLPNSDIKVLLSNNCYFTDNPKIHPFKYGDSIIISKCHIKMVKKINEIEQMKEIYDF